MNIRWVVKVNIFAQHIRKNKSSQDSFDSLYLISWQSKVENEGKITNIKSHPNLQRQKLWSEWNPGNIRLETYLHYCQPRYIEKVFSQN